MTDEILKLVASRLDQGATLKQLASEMNCSWQRLEKALRHSGLRSSARAVKRAGGKTAVRMFDPGLPFRHKPEHLEDLLGQDRAKNFLTGLTLSPFPCTLLFHGPTGVGKTSAAMVLANELGIAVNAGPLGGFIQIASGEQTADTLREVWQGMNLRPMYGSGWKILVVNECDRMSQAAETIWLDRLESIPAKTVIVFTTNHPDKLSRRFLDRNILVKFVGQADQSMFESGCDLIRRICQKEFGVAPEKDVAMSIVKECVHEGELSFRRIVTHLQYHGVRLPVQGENK